VVAALGVTALCLAAAPVASAAGNIVVTDVACYTGGPYGYSFTVHGTGFGGPGQSVVWIGDSLYTGAPRATQPVPVTIDSSGSFAFSFTGEAVQHLPAVVVAAGLPVAGGNTVQVPVGSVACVPPPAPSLVVSSAASVASVAAGANASFPVTVENDGNADAHDVTLMENASGPGLITAMSAGQGTCSVVPPTLVATCSLGTIPAGQSVSATAVVTTLGVGSVSASASVSTTDGQAGSAVNTAPAVAVAVTKPNADGSCAQSGNVHADGQFGGIHVQVDARCAPDGTLRAHVHLEWPRTAACDAVRDDHRSDIASVAIVGSGATIGGTCAGQPFTIQLNDGGDPQRDTMHAMWGANGTAAAGPVHLDVHVTTT